MLRTWTGLVIAGALVALLPQPASALTRDLAELQKARLTFDRSILNQLSFDTYRDPFDELQTRPYNLLFQNIGRYPNLSPWQDQEGNYTRYVNALIGNNGTANVDNNADSVQGAMIRRETAAIAWGVSGAYLAGNDGSDDTSGTVRFFDSDDISGFDVRAAIASQLTERMVLGGGLRATHALSEDSTGSFESGVGGFFEKDSFEQTELIADVGIRSFLTSRSSWETGVSLGFGTFDQNEFSENIDDAGAATDRFVITNYDISDLSLMLHAGYNRLHRDKQGETEYRVSLGHTQRELDNNDLSYTESSGGITPSLTLLGQDAIASTSLALSAKTVFQAGETEMFAGARLRYLMLDGSTQVDAAGFIQNEAVDDTAMQLGLTVGLRQPLVGDKLRVIVSGHADFANDDRETVFDTSSNSDTSDLSTALYAVGLEGVLANVTFDVAWLTGEEASVVPVAIGLPSGSRRSIEVDRLVFSAAVAW